MKHSKNWSPSSASMSTSASSSSFAASWGAGGGCFFFAEVSEVFFSVVLYLLGDAFRQIVDEMVRVARRQRIDDGVIDFTFLSIVGFFLCWFFCGVNSSALFSWGFFWHLEGRLTWRWF